MADVKLIALVLAVIAVSAYAVEWKSADFQEVKEEYLKLRPKDKNRIKRILQAWKTQSPKSAYYIVAMEMNDGGKTNTPFNYHIFKTYNRNGNVRIIGRLSGKHLKDVDRLMNELKDETSKKLAGGNEIKGRKLRKSG